MTQIQVLASGHLWPVASGQPVTQSQGWASAASQIQDLASGRMWLVTQIQVLDSGWLVTQILVLASGHLWPVASGQ